MSDPIDGRGELRMKELLLKTDCGMLKGCDNGSCSVFYGVPFAKAERFAYAAPAKTWDGVLDATKPGPACPQNRALHEHFEHPYFASRLSAEMDVGVDAAHAVPMEKSRFNGQLEERAAGLLYTNAFYQNGGIRE